MTSRPLKDSLQFWTFHFWGFSKDFFCQAYDLNKHMKRVNVSSHSYQHKTPLYWESERQKFSTGMRT